MCSTMTIGGDCWQNCGTYSVMPICQPVFQYEILSPLLFSSCPPFTKVCMHNLFLLFNFEFINMFHDCLLPSEVLPIITELFLKELLPFFYVQILLHFIDFIFVLKITFHYFVFFCFCLCKFRSKLIFLRSRL